MEIEFVYKDCHQVKCVRNHVLRVEQTVMISRNLPYSNIQQDTDFFTRFYITAQSEMNTAI